MNLDEVVLSLGNWIVPIVIFDIGLSAVALYSVLTHKTYKRGSRTLWTFLWFLDVVGPISYFAIGKGKK